MSPTSCGPSSARAPWASAGDLGLLALTLHLTPGAERPEREAVEAWQASEDGRRFVRLSSERWRAARIAAGTGAAEAHAAAERTTDFYSGEPAA